MLCAVVQTAARATDTPDFRWAGLLDDQRLEHRFDFEERKLGNFESMPMHWFRIARDGYPRYAKMGFDTAEHVSGTHSFKLQPNGGSVGVVLQPGVLAAMPGADYLVTARVRGEQLEHARIVLTGRFLDAQRRPIKTSEARSALVRSNGQWTTVWFRLDGLYERAAWIVLSMQVLQPGQFPAELRRSKLGEHRLDYRDVRATAWFDDVSVYQLPRIELHSDSPINLVTADQSPRLIATVRDLTGVELTSALAIYDQAGRQVDAMVHRDTLTSRPTWTWKPKLERLGWYRAELNVRSERGLVGRRQTVLAYLPTPGRANQPDARRFVLVAEHLDTAHRPLLLPLMDKTNGSAVVLSAWSALPTQTTDRSATWRSDPLLSELAAEGRDVTLCFDHVPADLAAGASTDVDAPLDLMTRTYALWRKPFETLLIRYGGLVDRWQIGATGSGAAFWREDLARVYPQAYGYFHQYIARPKVALAWTAYQPAPDPSAAVNALAMFVPRSIRPGQIPAYVRDWPTEHAEVTATLEPLPAGLYSHQQRADDLVLRMVHAWRTPVQRLAIVSPWRAVGGRAPTLEPDALLAVWSNTAGRLTGRRVVGQMNLGQGLVCWVLDGPAGGALVAWNRNAPPEQARIALYLGPAPVAIDPWGNRQALATDAQGRHQLTLTATPVFIEGIDVMLARLRGSFRIDPSFVRSVYKMHKHTLELTNPYPRSIYGTLRITGPAHWKIGPRKFYFTAQPGQTVHLPLELNFPLSELAGQKMITAELDLGGESERPITLAAPLTLGLRDVVYSPTVFVDATAPTGGGDVVITALVTNLGTEPQSFYAFALAPDQPRIERIIDRLAPGQTMLKRFRFVHAAAQLSGRIIRTGLRELDGAAILNTTVQVP